MTKPKARTSPGPVEEVKLAKGDAVTVDGKPGHVTGFNRQKTAAYVRFVEKGAGLFPLDYVTRSTKR